MSKKLQARIDALEKAVYILHIYSRRYCDGRKTYAPDDHNTITRQMQELGVRLPVDPSSTTGPFASDGTYGLSPEDRAALAKLDAQP